MRDTETVRARVPAAETGHLVFSTLHTIDATETDQPHHRLLPAAPAAQVRMSLAGSLRGIVCQRLVDASTAAGRRRSRSSSPPGGSFDRIVDPDETHEIEEIIAEGEYYGMQTFDQSLLELLKNGKISTDAAMQAVSSRHDFELAMQQAGLVVPV